MSEQTLPTEPTPEQPPVAEEVVQEPDPVVAEEIVVEQPPVAEEVVQEPDPVVAEEIVVEQPPVEEVAVIEPTNQEILLDFGTLKSSQSGLIRRGAITTLSLNGISDPTEQEIAETVCALFKQHSSWEALVELDSRFYR